MSTFTSIEICAGAGGQALGLEQAGFGVECAVEIDSDACDTLTNNRSNWVVRNEDINNFDASEYQGIDLFAGGVPCPPFSIAGKQLGHKDERDLFPRAIDLISQCNPTAIMLENVRGLSTARFESYRNNLIKKLNKLGYEIFWDVLYASDYGVPQLRPRFIMVGIKKRYASNFVFPARKDQVITVADSIYDLISSRGWKGADNWKHNANKVAPTIVGGSKKHGGADLGPTRAKKQWEDMGVDGRGIANEILDESYPIDFMPRLTLEMVARIQGFPDSWTFMGKKTSKYRQIGNAFPPPVARGVASSIIDALNGVKRDHKSGEQYQIPLASNS